MPDDPRQLIDKKSLSGAAAKTRSKSATPYVLSVLPVNVAVFQGDNATLICEAVNDGFYRIQWWEFASNPEGNIVSDGNTIISSHPQADRYTIVQPTPETYNLHIQDVRWEDAGRYMCEDIFNGPPTTYRGTAQLIVIGWWLLAETVTACCSNYSKIRLITSDAYL